MVIVDDGVLRSFIPCISSCLFRFARYFAFFISFSRVDFLTILMLSASCMSVEMVFSIGEKIIAPL